MADVLTKEQRHRNMVAIRGKDTKPELLVRKFLFSRGFRYRLNHPRLPGHPDLVLRKYRTVIFVNGCFWHGMGWHCITIWECQLKPKVRIQTLESLAYTLNHIFLEDRKIKTYKFPDTDSTLVAAEPEVTYGKRGNNKS